MKFVNTNQLENLIDGLRDMEAVVERLRETERWDTGWGIGYDPRAFETASRLTTRVFMNTGSGYLKCDLFVEGDEWVSTVVVGGSLLDLEQYGFSSSHEDPVEALKDAERTCAETLMDSDLEHQKFDYSALAEWAEGVLSDER